MANNTHMNRQSVAKFLTAVAQTMEHFDIELEEVIGDISKVHYRHLARVMVAQGFDESRTNEVYEQACSEIFKRHP